MEIGFVERFRALRENAPLSVADRDVLIKVSDRMRQQERTVEAMARFIKVAGNVREDVPDDISELAGALVVTADDSCMYIDRVSKGGGAWGIYHGDWCGNRAWFEGLIENGAYWIEQA